MKISGFSYIRNGFSFGYPFLEAIQSVLPICDEFIIAVGDSDDGTREAIVALASPKIRIIDTVWDMNLREGGRIFSQQANIALDHITGDWGFHIQADEAIHEKDLPRIREAIKKYNDKPEIEGFVFNFLNFYGGYNYIGSTRRWHRREVRIIRNKPEIRSYRDSQGFRIYPSRKAWEEGHPGRSLKCAYIDVDIFHYSYCRNPLLMQKKANYFNRFWHDDEWVKNNSREKYNFSEIDDLVEFTGTHPAVIHDRMAKKDWDFVFDRSNARFSSLRHQFLYYIEKWTGWRIGEYRNYRIIEKVFV